MLLPAILTGIVTYLGAHDVMKGTLEPGQLVTFFGYAMFLTTPLRTAIEYIIATTRAYVGARKVLASSTSTIDDRPDVAAPLARHVAGSTTRVSGISIRRGQLVAFVTETPAEAVAIADRLGRFVPDVDGVTLDGTPMGSSRSPTPDATSW